MTTEAVDHPKHYNSHPSGVECIDVVEHMSFNVGNAMKYLWRADEKGRPLEDLRKAAWYIQREIDKRTRPSGPQCPSVAPSLTPDQPPVRCVLAAGHEEAHCDDDPPAFDSTKWWPI